jgi:GNAT superfamily N-acetyltransferase
MSLYGDYIKEREGKKIIEEDYGFVTYQIFGDQVYIEDMFIEKQCRRSGLAFQLADDVREKAKEHGCKKMLTSVVPSANGSTESVKVILAYGFRLMSAQDNFIMFEMEI